MNLCDNPHSVSVGQEWAAVRPRGRVPIFVTANDLSLLYAVRGSFVADECVFLGVCLGSTPAPLRACCTA